MRRGFLEAIWPSYVDRDLPVTRVERKAIHKDAWRVWMENRWNLAMYFALIVACVALQPVARDLCGRLAVAAGVTGIGYRVARIGGLVGVLLVGGGIAGYVFQRYRFAPLVYEATRRRGFDVCRRCGYWMRGLGEECARCPECGAEREAVGAACGGSEGA